MKIMFKTKFGSHLYGTNTENSDTDYKGVFKCDLDDIILKKDKKVISQTTKIGGGTIHGVRNEATDVETEFKEIREFIKDCQDGQTYALDMLFAPKDCWLESTPDWEYIVSHRDKLLSKNVEPYIGYCRQQAGKYGLKGSRLGELIRVIEFLKKQSDHDKLGEVVDYLGKSEFVEVVEIECPRPHGETPIKEKFLNVLGKKFQFNRHIKEILVSLLHMQEKYGSRAKQAQQNEGIDWKAISHAYRCCNQLKELAQTGAIKFPLDSAPYLLRIKKGEIDYKIVQEELFELMQVAVNMVKQSNLPESPDYAFWENYILDLYYPHT